MREKTSQTALLLLSAALLAPAASAHSLKPAHAAAPRKSAHAAETLRTSAHTRARESAKAEEHRASKSSNRADLHTTDRHAENHLVANRRAIKRVAAEQRIEDRRIREPKPSREHHPAPIEAARLQPAAEDPAPEAASVELPPIEVRHNRKIHLTPQAAAPAPDVTPRQATVQDFLDTPAAPAENNLGDAQPAAETPTAAATTRQPISLVERKPAALPVVKPAPVLVPDPVIEPVLYTSRGRLIVPPAMKGSHEILVHQNEMADRDGLIRVQDDEDLERLRALKQLVALPAGPALIVDERLPSNRRFCRPWTAQFLAALARAHYARFHTPLQVNSAVRTVQFQERLRYTNGNAAPAEGETASPHLTGQAVDLAKHGLSMTEIAWIRGYLMPLVQQGKVDVEEEFQQSCFHISVYKSYLPQPAPRREIPTRHSPATALATAIR
jgi:hypothetical protein